MKKLLKKVCGFLCLGVAIWGIGNVKASNGDLLFVMPSQLEVDNDGNFSMEIWVSRCDELLMGDVDENGVIELNDAHEILKYVEGTSDIVYTNKFKVLADVDKDKQITVTDAELVEEVALKINEDGLGTTNWYTYYSESEINSLNYFIVNENSSSDILFDLKYFLENEKSFTYTSSYIHYNSPIYNTPTYIHLKPSASKTSISGYFGLSRFDNLYVILGVTFNDGSVYTDIMKYDVSNDSYWEFLNDKDESTKDETENSGTGSVEDESTKEETSKNETIKDEGSKDDTSKDESTKEDKKEETSKDEGKKNETKIEVETETEVKSEIKTESKKEENKTEEKEETVENPDTGVAIPLVSSIITIVISVVAKKKNLFSRI